MNILYFYQYFGTPEGGWSTRVYEMCRRWVKEGHEINVITALYDKSDLRANGIYSKFIIEGINVYVVNIYLSNKHNFGYRIYTFLVYALVASFLGLRLKTDVIIASSGPITIGFPALISKWLKRKPLVFEVRDLWPDGAVAFKILKNTLIIKLAYWFEASCYKTSSLIVSCSKGITESISMRFPKTKIITIPNAADVELFRETKIDFSSTVKYDKYTFFIYTGTLGLIDDCGQILRAASILQKKGRKDIKILMIGDGKQRHFLENLAQELELSNLIFLGLMSKLNLIGFVRKARASILTVQAIPFMDKCSPNKMFDAFAAGIPILQTTQGWIKELVTEEECGINVIPNDANDFANAMILLADNDELFEKMSQNSAQLGDSMFNRELLSLKMLKAIEGLV